MPRKESSLAYLLEARVKRSRKEAIDKIEEFVPLLDEHLLKLFLFPGQNNELWRREIWAFADRINRVELKMKKGKFSAKEYEDMLNDLAQNREFFVNHVANILLDFKGQTPQYDISTIVLHWKTFQKRFGEFFNGLALLLSTNLTREKLNHLLDEFTKPLPL